MIQAWILQVGWEGGGTAYACVERIVFKEEEVIKLREWGSTGEIKGLKRIGGNYVNTALMYEILKQDNPKILKLQLKKLLLQNIFSTCLF